MMYTSIGCKSLIMRIYFLNSSLPLAHFKARFNPQAGFYDRFKDILFKMRYRFQSISTGIVETV